MSSDFSDDRFSSAETETTIRPIDWSVKDPVSTAIVDAVSRSTGVDTVSLPPLQRFVDGDALNHLFDRETDCEFRFEYAGLAVVVSATDGVTVR